MVEDQISLAVKGNYIVSSMEKTKDTPQSIVTSPSRSIKKYQNQIIFNHPSQKKSITITQYPSRSGSLKPIAQWIMGLRPCTPCYFNNSSHIHHNTFSLSKISGAQHKFILWINYPLPHLLLRRFNTKLLRPWRKAQQTGQQSTTSSQLRTTSSPS